MGLLFTNVNCKDWVALGCAGTFSAWLMAHEAWEWEGLNRRGEGEWEKRGALQSREPLT